MLHVYVSGLQLAPRLRKRPAPRACCTLPASLAVAVQFLDYPLLVFHCSGSTDGSWMGIDAGRACMLPCEQSDLARHVSRP